MLADEHSDFPYELCVAAERKVGLEPPFERPETELFEARSLCLRKRFIAEVGGRLRAPELVDEPVCRDDFVRTREQECEQRPLPHAAEREHAAVLDDLEWS